jgi:hypothetical protein
VSPTEGFDLYAWAAPRDLSAEAAAELVDGWLAAGGDPAASPFEPSTDVAWYYRELTKDLPDIDAVSDGAPNTRSRPIFLETDDPPPARVVAIRLTRDLGDVELDEVFGLAMKYDLVLFDPSAQRLGQPLAAMSAFASATFWPHGAIRSIVAGLIGAGLAVGAWVASIPIVSGVVVGVGLFLVVLTAATLGAETRAWWRRRRGGRRGGAARPRA